MFGLNTSRWGPLHKQADQDDEKNAPLGCVTRREPATRTESEKERVGRDGATVTPYADTATRPVIVDDRDCWIRRVAALAMVIVDDAPCARSS